MAKERPTPKLSWDKISQADREEALKLLAKKKDRLERIKRGELKGSTGISWKDMTPEQKAKARMYAYRRNIRLALLAKKATAAGITVTDHEVDEALRAKE